MMKPRIRISTLMFLVVIAALVATLAIERRRHAEEVASLKAPRFRVVQFSANAGPRFDSRFAPTE